MFTSSGIAMGSKTQIAPPEVIGRDCLLISESKEEPWMSFVPPDDVIIILSLGECWNISPIDNTDHTRAAAHAPDGFRQE